MRYQNIEILESFGPESIPDLDTAVLGALELFEKDGVPSLEQDPFNLPLVVGSGNALSTGKILYRGRPAVMSDESSFKLALEANPAIDGAVIISASGGKSAVGVAEFLKGRNIEIRLLTTNPRSAAGAIAGDENVSVFPKNREPYAYNTSTYLGMILSKTGESPTSLLKHIQSELAGNIPADLAKYDALFFILPTEFAPVGEMLVTKCEELFGPKVSARVHSPEGAKHAKTIVRSDKELFVHIGGRSDTPGAENALTLPLSEKAGCGAAFAAGYYLLGQVQKTHPPYFKENIASYVEEASKLFGENLSAIVE